MSEQSDMIDDWGDMFSRADGSHMTQMDVDGGRVLTVRSVQVVAYDKKERTALVSWHEDVLPWLMPQQEGLLLKALGWSPSIAQGRRLFVDRDASVKFGRDVVGGSRIFGSPDIDSDMTVRWRCGKRKLERKLRRVPDPDPLWGLVVVRWGVSWEAVDAWALSKGMKTPPSQLTGAARDQIAGRLDKPENLEAIRAFLTADAGGGAA